MPDTCEPFCVKITSESPKPLPVVHHFPFIVDDGPAEAESSSFRLLALRGEVDFRGVDLLPVLLVAFAAGLVVGAVEGAGPVTVPPEGWAAAEETQVNMAQTVHASKKQV